MQNIRGHLFSRIKQKSLCVRKKTQVLSTHTIASQIGLVIRYWPTVILLRAQSILSFLSHVHISSNPLNNGFPDISKHTSLSFAQRETNISAVYFMRLNSKKLYTQNLLREFIYKRNELGCISSQNSTHT